jgi:hypothetical protein
LDTRLDEHFDIWRAAVKGFDKVDKSNNEIVMLWIKIRFIRCLLSAFQHPKMDRVRDDVCMSVGRRTLPVTSLKLVGRRCGDRG